KNTTTSSTVSDVSDRKAKIAFAVFLSRPGFKLVDIMVRFLSQDFATGQDDQASGRLGRCLLNRLS
ncbi:hypothetical protein PSYPI_43506, partial [Pseudomonas syringae pv. pisi str. 1704B]